MSQLCCYVKIENDDVEMFHSKPLVAPHFITLRPPYLTDGAVNVGPGAPNLRKHIRTKTSDNSLSEFTNQRAGWIYLSQFPASMSKSAVVSPELHHFY